MSKRIDIDGRSYRMRRGKLVEIPLQWLGKVTADRTIRNRPSKMHHKLRRAQKNLGHGQFLDKREAYVE